MLGWLEVFFKCIACVDSLIVFHSLLDLYVCASLDLQGCNTGWGK